MSADGDEIEITSFGEVNDLFRWVSHRVPHHAIMALQAEIAQFLFEIVACSQNWSGIPVNCFLGSLGRVAGQNLKERENLSDPWIC